MRRIIDAIADATGLALNRELEEWMAMMAGAQQGLSSGRARKPLLPCNTKVKIRIWKACCSVSQGPFQKNEQRWRLWPLTTRCSKKRRLSRGRRPAGGSGWRESNWRPVSDAGTLMPLATWLAWQWCEVISARLCRFFQIAMEANPEHIDVALLLGYAWISGGELSHADRVFADVI